MDLMDLLENLPFKTTIQVKMLRFNIAEVTWQHENHSVTKVIPIDGGWASGALVSEAKRQLVDLVGGAL